MLALDGYCCRLDINGLTVVLGGLTRRLSMAANPSIGEVVVGGGAGVVLRNLSA